MRRGAIHALVLIVLLAFGATTAWAQAAKYPIAETTGKYEPPPAGATTLALSGDDAYVVVNLPFTFNHYNPSYTQCTVCTNGFLTLGSANYTTSVNTIYPLTTIKPAMCPYWDDLNVGSGSVKTWTTGTSPNSHFVVSWEGVQSAGGVGPMTFQVQLYETTDAYVLAYAPGGNYPSTGYTLGSQAQGNNNWELPPSIQNSATANNGKPPYDYTFGTFPIFLTGRALYDRYVVDATGIGNSVETSVPLAGIRVEARNALGATVGAAFTTATGDFTLPVSGVQPTDFGSIVVASASNACSVRKVSGGALTTLTLVSNVPFAASAAVGTWTLGETQDAGGPGRAVLHIAQTIEAEYQWAKARTSKSISVLDPVLYDGASTAVTSYAPAASPLPATMTVAGAASGNPDPWDSAVIRRTYARHVLGAIAANPGVTMNAAFDAKTSDANAFAEGFGYYMNAIVSGARAFLDGASATSTPVAIDVESPSGLATPPASDVAATLAQALYDIADPANESFDAFDGTGAPGEQAFATVASLSAPVTATTFATAWFAKGYDAASLTRSFIHFNLIVDDADEPNDSAAEAVVVPEFGFVRTDHVLNVANDDWFRFTLPAATDAVTASVVYARATNPGVTLLVEVRDLAGTVQATGAPLAGDGGVGPILAKTGPLAAGDYRIHVGFSAGGPLSAYTLQVFSAVDFRPGEFRPWTVNRPMTVPVTIDGGVPPYTLAVIEPFIRPDGLVLDPAGITGAPTGPQPPATPIPPGGSFTYNFVLTAQDSANPPNTDSATISFTVHDALAAQFGEFVAFAAGKAVDRLGPFSGGTPPFQFAFDEGGLPPGLALAGGDDLRFKGNAAAASASFRLTASDIAGSAAGTDGAVFAVVCAPAGPAPGPMASGKSACGFWFDALAGSVVGLKIATVKGSPVRTFRTAEVLDTDGGTTLPPVAKFGKGKASMSTFTAPRTGRFYVVVASDAGDATSLVCAAKVTPPKGGKGGIDRDLRPGSDPFVVEVGALAGATLTFSAKPDKSGLVLGAAYLIDPKGAAVPFAAGEVTEKKGAVSFSKTLAVAGTWRVVVVGKAGPSGRLTYSFGVKQPKTAYAAD